MNPGRVRESEALLVSCKNNQKLGTGESTACQSKEMKVRAMVSVVVLPHCQLNWIYIPEEAPSGCVCEDILERFNSVERRPSLSVGWGSQMNKRVERRVSLLPDLGKNSCCHTGATSTVMVNYEPV